MDDYYRYLPHHLAGCDAWQELFDLIDNGNFLIKKADQFQRYSDLSSDIEQYAISGAIQKEDWFRFVHYALLAANLRGLAETLAKEEILRALVLNDQYHAALDIATHLSNPLDRAWSIAVIAGTSSLRSRSASFNKTIRESLDTAPAPSDVPEAQRWFSALKIIIRYCGAESVSHFIPFVDRLSRWPDIYDDLWLAIARTALEQTGVQAESLFWEALQHVKDPQRRIEQIPEVLKRVSPAETDSTIKALRTLSGSDKELFWLGCAALVGATMSDSAAAAWRKWNDIAQNDGEIPWSPDLIEAGRRFFGNLEKAHFADFLQGISDSVTRAAIGVSRLEELGTQATYFLAQNLVDVLPPGLERCTLELRLIRAMPEELTSARRARLMSIAGAFHKANYNVRATDLSQFLDLIASLFPHRLADFTACALYAQATSAETLHEIIASAETLALCEHLIKGMSRYAANIANTPKDAFELRQAEMIRLSVKICLKQKDLGALKAAEEFLLPEELDEAYQEVALSMAAVKAFDLAHKAVQSIRSRPLSLITNLRVLQYPQAESLPDNSLAHLIRFESLYNAMADTNAVEDERLALTALLERPHTPHELVNKYLTPIKDNTRRARAFIDFARHVLVYQEERYSKKHCDSQQIANLLQQAAGLIREDQTLISVIPDLTELLAKTRIAHAVTEYAEAVNAVTTRTSVSWNRRLQALQALFAQMPAILFSDPALSWEQTRIRCKETAACFNQWADKLPATHFGPTTDDGADHRRQLLALMTVALRKMPPIVSGYLYHPFQTQVCVDWLPFIGAVMGRKRFWFFIGRFEKKYLPQWLQKRFETARQRVFEIEQGEISHLVFLEKDQIPERFDGEEDTHNLANAVVRDFQSGGRPAGISSLQLWLNTYLYNRLGWENRVLLEESKHVNLAIKRAQTLKPPQHTDQQDEPDTDRIYHRKREQLTRLYKKWKYEKKWALGDSFRESLSDVGLLLGISSFPLLICLDIRVSPLGSFLGNISGPDAVSSRLSYIFSILCLTYLLNAWMTDRYLAYRKTPGVQINNRVRYILFLLGGIPLFGLYANVIWQWLMEKAAPEMEKGTRNNASLNTYRLYKRINRFRRWFLNAWVRFDRWALWLWWQNFHIWWLILGNTIIICTICIGYLTPRLVSEHRGLLIGITWMLHIYVCVGVLYYLWDQAKEVRASLISLTLRLMLAVFWLIPIPLLSLAGLFLLLFHRDPKKKESIIHQAYNTISAIDRLPIWLELKANLQREWGRAGWWKRLKGRPVKLDQSQKMSDAQKKRITIYNIECIALLGEAATLSWLLTRMASNAPGFDYWDGKIAIGLFFALIAGGLGALLWFVAFILSLARSQSALQKFYQHDYIQYFTKSQLAFFCGLVMGTAFETKDYNHIWIVLTLGGLTGAIANSGPDLLSIILPVYERVRKNSVYTYMIPVVWSIIGLIGLAGIKDVQGSASNLLFLSAFLKIAPFFKILSLLLVGWLLRPFEIWDMFKRDRPKRVRIAIAFTLLTVILPLGSLCIPVWIYINHRVWPKYEADLPNSGKP